MVIMVTQRTESHAPEVRFNIIKDYSTGEVLGQYKEPRHVDPSNHGRVEPRV